MTHKMFEFFDVDGSGEIDEEVIHPKLAHSVRSRRGSYCGAEAGASIYPR